MNRRWKKIDRKTAALTLLLIVACAAIMGELMITARAAVTKSANSSTDTIVSDVCDNVNNLQVWSDMITGNLDVNGTISDASKVEVIYKANMTIIVTGDSNIHNPSSQDCKTPTISPSVKNTIEVDKTLATQTTTATVTLQNVGQRASEITQTVHCKDSNRQSQ